MSSYSRHAKFYLLALILCISLTQSVCAATGGQQKPNHGRKVPKFKKIGKILLQKVRDEFNTTEDPTKPIDLNSASLPLLTVQGQDHSAAAAVGVRMAQSKSPTLKKFLLRLELDECCPTWAELTQMPDIQEEQRKLHGKSRALMRVEDLMDELNQIFVNITHYSIDGQEGQSEWQKYYKFYDNVHYYLRLVKVAEEYLRPANETGGRNETARISKLKITKSVRRLSGLNDDELTLVDRDIRRQFRRQLKSIQFKISQDPIMSSFMRELLSISQNGRHNDHFEHYENFISDTQFGQYYARNISMVRESIQVLELIGSHLETLSFPSNLTRPSKVYKMIRSMSRKLFRTKHELIESVSGRILTQRQDVRRAFRLMDNLIVSRPDIRMLGDEFAFDSSPPGVEFSANVRHLTRLLDAYTTNNMTHLTFYNQLSSLPEEFILLGLVVAHEYETKEMPQNSKFNSDFYNWNYSSSGFGRPGSFAGDTQEQENSTSTTVESARSHQGDRRPFYSRILFG